MSSETTAPTGVDAMRERIADDLSIGLPEPADIPLRARTDVSALLDSAVGAASAAAAAFSGRSASPVDGDRVAVSSASDRHFRLDGEGVSAFAPLSGFFATRDGHVRTHANYPHHEAALRRALGLEDQDGPDEARVRLASLSAHDAAQRIRVAGGVVHVVVEEDPAADADARTTPLVVTTPIGTESEALGFLRSGDVDPTQPLRGVRVLDLTRVIAGPVAGRILASLGADVLRIDPPVLAEIPWQHLDTGHGKRSAVLDVSDPRFTELLTQAHVILAGYRPGALARRGLSPEAVAAASPGIVIGRVSAWGPNGGRGFDSIVQAASGLSRVEGSADEPGRLPVQALDHAAGHLLAAGVMRALASGGGRMVEVSLRRIAAELLALPRVDDIAEVAPVDPAPHLQSFELDGARLVTTAPTLSYPGAPAEYRAPRPWGGDEPRWAEAP